MSGHAILNSCHNCGIDGSKKHLQVVAVTDNCIDGSFHIHVIVACDDCKKNIWEK